MGGGYLKFWDYFVLNVFTTNFHYVPNRLSDKHVPQVPKVFLNMFPIASHFVQYDLPNIIFLEPTYENIMGTKEKKNSILTPPHPPFRKGKKMNPIRCMFNCFIGSMHILFLDMGQSELAATNALVAHSIHYMGCVFSFGIKWGSSQSISLAHQCIFF